MGCGWLAGDDGVEPTCRHTAPVPCLGFSHPADDRLRRVAAYVAERVHSPLESNFGPPRIPTYGLRGLHPVHGRTRVEHACRHPNAGWVACGPQGIDTHGPSRYEVGRRPLTGPRHHQHDPRHTSGQVGRGQYHLHDEPQRVSTSVESAPAPAPTMAGTLGAPRSTTEGKGPPAEGEARIYAIRTTPPRAGQRFWPRRGPPKSQRQGQLGATPGPRWAWPARWAADGRVLTIGPWRVHGELQ